jgi:hypothetical protein
VKLLDRRLKWRPQRSPVMGRSRCPLLAGAVAMRRRANRCSPHSEAQMRGLRRACEAKAEGYKTSRLC